ncbi:hypothetical protein EC12741_A0273 [Escherichia coli 1.2741]|nr:hypothetical protein EC12741_A0273 [Escherichia coli 1.2741]
MTRGYPEKESMITCVFTTPILIISCYRTQSEVIRESLRLLREKRAG